MNAIQVRDIDAILAMLGVHYDPDSELYYRKSAVVEIGKLEAALPGVSPEELADYEIAKQDERSGRNHIQTGIDKLPERNG